MYHRRFPKRRRSRGLPAGAPSFRYCIGTHHSNNPEECPQDDGAFLLRCLIAQAVPIPAARTGFCSGSVRNEIVVARNGLLVLIRTDQVTPDPWSLEYDEYSILLERSCTRLDLPTSLATLVHVGGSISIEVSFAFLCIFKDIGRGSITRSLHILFSSVSLIRHGTNHNVSPRFRNG